MGRILVTIAVASVIVGAASASALTADAAPLGDRVTTSDVRDRGGRRPPRPVAAPEIDPAGAAVPLALLAGALLLVAERKRRAR